ncbi:MAG: ABC transporter ATP-binding protein/permease, partial [Eubacteriales bacterium]|nr:ABC transporter ATP-binding protein/permease [Eubacteriales bacterium]
IMTRMGQNVIYEIRKDIFTHIQKLPFSYFDNKPHGKIQVRVVNYVNSLSDLLSNGIVNTLTDLGSLIFVIIFMLFLNVRLTLVCMLGLPFLTALIIYIKSKQRKAWQMTSNKQSNLNAYIAESINGIRITQSFVREDENRAIFNRLSSAYRDSWLQAVKYSHLMSPAVDNISAITLSLVYVLGVNWISKGSEVITAGILVSFSSYIGRFWSPINTLASFYNSLINAVAYIERIFETIDEPIDVKDKDGAIEMPEIEGNIEFKNVEFKYEEDGNPILNGITFKAKKGESFAIVGPTGAGKTTIVNLLSRFYNINSGEILIDGINIEDVTIKSLRTQMGVMMQESFIFSGTIMDNIRYGNKEATDNEVIEAAKIVCAHDFIMAMEDGYNTVVKERGSGLSAGQKQLISFARALLANPKILILDEATSSIDTETEIALQEGLKRLLENRTSFIIAHRLSTIKNCDTILYVDKGQIVEKGNHNELIEKKANYYNLYMSQYEFLKKEKLLKDKCFII